MSETLRERSVQPAVPRSRRTLLVLAGDLVAILAFVVVGVYSHGGYPWEMPQYTFETFAPFLLAWTVVSPLAGIYDSETVTRATVSIPLVVGTWVVAAVLGGLLRATSLFAGNAPLEFILVTILFGSLFLASWRLLATWILQWFERRSSDGP